MACMAQEIEGHSVQVEIEYVGDSKPAEDAAKVGTSQEADVGSARDMVVDTEHIARVFDDATTCRHPAQPG